MINMYKFLLIDKNSCKKLAMDVANHNARF